MIHDFKCATCERIETDIYLPMNHVDDDHPHCCGAPMGDYHTKAPTVHWKDYDLPDGGFRAAHDGTVITTKKQNREYMERHGLRDANDEFAPPTPDAEARERAEAQAAIDAITPSDDMMERMKADGTLAKIEEIYTGE